jgi:DNA-binding CsgD family transcriptional regulator
VRTYSVRAKRWEHGWELHIEGVGVTQSHGLRDAEMMVRDLISRRLGVPEDSFSVEVTPEIGNGLDERATAARAAVRAAASAQQKAAAQSREAARLLQRAGLTGRDIAAVLQVSPQRVSQLLRDPGEGAREDAEPAHYAAG